MFRTHTHPHIALTLRQTGEVWEPSEKQCPFFQKWRSSGCKSTVTFFFVKGSNDNCGCHAGSKVAGAWSWVLRFICYWEQSFVQLSHWMRQLQIFYSVRSCCRPPLRPVAVASGCCDWLYYAPCLLCVSPSLLLNGKGMGVGVFFLRREAGMARRQSLNSI
jgi:hypothetical protein